MTDQDKKDREMTPENTAMGLADKAGIFLRKCLASLMGKAGEATTAKPKPTSYYSRFLSRAVLLEESGPPQAIVTTIGLISVFVFGCLIWSMVTTLNETTVAIGEIRPDSTIQPVQHLEGGIVSQVLVKNGDRVKKGQVILVMAPTVAASELDRITARHASIDLKISRLKAFVFEREENFSTYEKPFPNLVQDQKDILLQQNRSLKAQQNVIISRVGQQKNELSILKKQEQTQKQNLHIIGEELKIREELTQKGLGSRIRLLEIQREHNKAHGEVQTIQNKQISVASDINQAEGTLIEMREKLFNEALTQVDSLSAERVQVASEMTRLQDKVKRLNILSPVDGFIKGMKYRTIGSIVTPGDVVAEVVPESDMLVAEVKISPRDIGHVKMDRQVLIKIDTYNYARYGGMAGTLSHVSAASFMDDKGETYFKGIVELPQNYLGADPKSNRITPGMTVVADIKTGEKTLLQYLVKPINNALDTAFRER